MRMYTRVCVYTHVKLFVELFCNICLIIFELLGLNKYLFKTLLYLYLLFL